MRRAESVWRRNSLKKLHCYRPAMRPKSDIHYAPCLHYMPSTCITMYIVYIIKLYNIIAISPVSSENCLLCSPDLARSYQHLTSFELYCLTSKKTIKTTISVREHIFHIHM